MNNFNIDHILSRKIAGECSPKEEHAFRGWLEEDPMNRMIYERMLALKNAEVKRGKYLFMEKSFEDIWEKSSNHDKHKIRHLTNYKVYLRVAASFAFIFLFYLFSTRVGDVDFHKKQAIEYVVKKTPIGQKSKVLLADGSYVWLNAESSIRYVKNFTDSIRLIELSGEAYFKVKKDAARKFVVVAGNTSITALGTEFNVNSYAENEAPSVALTEGKVEVEFKNLFLHKSTTISPGFMTTFSEKKEDFIITQFDNEEITSWKDGTLIFKEADFYEVVKKLERWYGVTISYNRLPSKSWQFTGTFKNEYLENVLNVLGFGEDFKYKMDGDSITLII